jgi:hypothetical protein
MNLFHGYSSINPKIRDRFRISLLILSFPNVFIGNLVFSVVARERLVRRSISEEGSLGGGGWRTVRGNLSLAPPFRKGRWGGILIFVIPEVLTARRP